MAANKSLLGPPSKVFSYLTLPIPRIAVVADAERDETAAYVGSRNGWLVVEPDARDMPMCVAEHVRRQWSVEELKPPASEAWPAVAAEIDAFLSSLVRFGRPEGTSERSVLRGAASR